MKASILEDVIARLNCLEKAVFREHSTVSSNAKRKSSPPDGLPTRILKLRDQGFFTAPKTPNETHCKLQPVYHCEPDRVAVALLRLQRRKELRKTSKIIDKKKQLAYVW
ncbi:MAG: hypothetical protein C4293_06400 [Nitrospiraceae bacterium]